MKAITIHQPYASLAAVGVKPDETRGWRGMSALGQRIAIHAGMSGAHANACMHPNQLLYQMTVEQFGCGPDELPRGAVVGTAVVSEFIRTEDRIAALTRWRIATGDYGPGRWAWVLTSAVWLPVPVYCRGAQGLWELPANVLAKVRWESRT